MSFNTDKLREKLIKQEQRKEHGGSDPRFLNYFNLDFGQQMTIRVLPDGGTSDELWLEYSQHGPNLDSQDVENISCAKTSSGERCPACSYSYSFHKEGMKDDAKKWRAKDVNIAQCIVVESPIEISQSPDGNSVKLIYLPYGMKEAMKEAIINQTITDPTACDFVIKKTKNQGGFASYDKSYFKTKESDLPESFLATIEAGTSYLYDLKAQLPEPATAEQVGVWLEKAIELEAKVKPTVARAASATPTSSVKPTTSDVEQPANVVNSSTPVVTTTAKVSAKDLINKLTRKA